MRITMNDGRVFQGTPLQIVQAMQAISFGGQGLTARQYIDSVVDDAQRFEGVTLATTGNTDAELAASLIDEMIRTGLAGRGRIAPDNLTDAQARGQPRCHGARDGRTR